MERVAERGDLARRRADGACDAVSDALGLRAESLACRGERDADHSFVVGIATPRDDALALEPLEQGRQRAGIEVEPLTETADGQAVPFPEDEEDEVLRVRDPERQEERGVRLRHGAGRRMKREAELSIEAERVVSHFKSIVHNWIVHNT